MGNPDLVINVGTAKTLGLARALLM